MLISQWLQVTLEESAAASAGVGGGGYTASDSNRDAGRGKYMMGGIADMLEIYDWL